MAVYQNLFIRTKRSIAGIQLDAVLTESHLEDVSLSYNPVEYGAEIADNATIEPIEVSIVAEVTDTPLGASSFGEIVNNVTGKFGSSTSSNVTRSVAAYNAISELKKNRTLIDIQTKLRLYKNMIITSLSCSQDSESSNSANMFIVARELEIVKSETVSIAQDTLQSGETQQQGTSPSNQGKKATVEPSDSVKSTALRAISDFLGITEEG